MACTSSNVELTVTFCFGTYHEQILGRSHTGTKDRSGTKRPKHIGWHGPHLSSNDQEHLDVGCHDDQCCCDEAHCRERLRRSRIPTSHKSDHGCPTEICVDHADIDCTADYQARDPDGRDDCTYDAIGEDGKVGERSNNNGTLDDRHDSQVPDGVYIYMSNIWLSLSSGTGTKSCDSRASLAEYGNSSSSFDYCAYGRICFSRWTYLLKQSLDDGHGSQVPYGTQAKSVHTCVD